MLSDDCGIYTADAGGVLVGLSGNVIAGDRAIAVGGHDGNVTAGSYGTAIIAGRSGHAVAGSYGTAIIAGNQGTAIAGNHGIAIVSYGGTATAGDNGTIVISHWDGYRRRVYVGYVGENGLKADVPYCIKNGEFVEVHR